MFNLLLLFIAHWYKAKHKMKDRNKGSFTKNSSALIIKQ